MQFDEVIKLRQSCRNYDDTREVEKEKLIKIIDAGRIAPSACNSQPWSFVVVSEKGLREEVGEACRKFGGNKFTDKVNAFIVIVKEKPNLPERIGQFVEDHKFSDMDIGITTAHMVLAATNEGLGTCIMGMFNEDKLKEMLSIDKRKRIALVLAVGYPAKDDEIREKKRKDDSIVTYK